MSGWSVDQVLALAPDAASQKAGQGLATPRRWERTGRDSGGVWGLCQGSGASAYQTCVDLTGPAYRCSCPSRKFPCKHALALLLLWAGGQVPDGEPPDWVLEWREARDKRETRAATRAPAGPVSEKALARRAGRVEAGLDELDRWLADQVRQGLAGATRAGYSHWDGMAARLVDAQAPGAAGAVRRLAAVAGSPERLLTELGLLRLLVAGFRRLDELPPDLAATVRTRVGFPVSVEEVRAAPPVRDDWQVIGVRDEADEQLTTRRVWLRGAHTGQPALVLSFAPAGRVLPADLVLGTVLDADVCFYPGAQPLRALVTERHGEPRTAPPVGAESVSAALHGYAAALARDPWLERWPVLLDATPSVHSGQWYLVDHSGIGLPLAPYVEEPWPLLAVSGGEPLTVAAEWSPAGLRPLTAWSKDQVIRL